MKYTEIMTTCLSIALFLFAFVVACRFLNDWLYRKSVNKAKIKLGLCLIDGCEDEALVAHRCLKHRGCPLYTIDMQEKECRKVGSLRNNASTSRPSSFFCQLPEDTEHRERRDITTEVD